MSAEEDIILIPAALSLEMIDEIKFGPTSVQIFPDVGRSDSAFILAGPELFRFDLPSGNFRASQVVFEESEIEVCHDPSASASVFKADESSLRSSLSPRSIIRRIQRTSLWA